MENFDKFPYFSDEDVKIIAYCPFCEADLNPVRARVVDSNEEKQLVHLQCTKCKTYILALLIKTINGLSSVGLITDLNFNDVMSLKDKISLEADELINLHHKLKQKDIVEKILELN